jgi:hypothetical protein
MELDQHLRARIAADLAAIEDEFTVLVAAPNGSIWLRARGA